jgi:hypothetical protein
MKWLSFIPVVALAFLAIACEKHPYSQLPEEGATAFGKHSVAAAEAKPEAKPAGEPAAAAPAAAAPGAAAPGAAAPGAAAPGADAKPGEAPKFFPQNK